MMGKRRRRNLNLFDNGVGIPKKILIHVLNLLLIAALVNWDGINQKSVCVQFSLYYTG